MEQVTVEVDQDEAGSSDLEPGTPEHMDYSPDAHGVYPGLHRGLR